MSAWVLQQLGLVTLGTCVAIALWTIVRWRCCGCAVSAYRLSVVSLLAMLAFVPVQIGVAAWNASRASTSVSAPTEALIVTRDNVTDTASSPAAATHANPPADCAIPAVTATPGGTFPLSLVMLTLYGAGAGLMLTFVIVRCALAARLVSRASAVTDPYILDIWRDVQLRMRSPVAARLLESPSLDGPACFGPVRTCVLLPESDPRLRDPARLAMVLRHELTHLTRRDPLISVGAAILLAAQWFNPLVWAFARRLHEDKEASCDAAVVVATGNARAYALTLLDFGHTKGRLRGAAVFAGLGGNRLRGALNRRLRMIEAMSNSPTRTRSRIALVACLALGGGLPALHAGAAALQPAPPKPRAVNSACDSGVVKKAVIEAPPGDRSKPSMTPMQIAPLKFGDLRGSNVTEQETIAWAKNATLDGYRMEADEVSLSLPEGSRLVASVDGKEVFFEKSGDATLLRAIGGVVKITDANGVDRLTARAVRETGGTLRIDPRVENGSLSLKVVGQTEGGTSSEPAGIQAWVQEKSGEIEITLRSFGETSGRVLAEINTRVAMPTPDTKPETPAIRYELLSPAREGTKPVQLKMQWIYGDFTDGC